MAFLLLTDSCYIHSYLFPQIAMVTDYVQLLEKKPLNIKNAFLKTEESLSKVRVF